MSVTFTTNLNFCKYFNFVDFKISYVITHYIITVTSCEEYGGCCVQHTNIKSLC